MGIAPRIALFSWLVALSTLSIFVLVTVPQQKKVFFKNLESKANSVAVSLHDVAAGAAINEDYASVVSAGQTMLRGDSDVAFLAVVKNDGFSMFMTQTGWKSENRVDTSWLPYDRKTAGKIEITPLLDRRVFHYAQPFNYSGIYWGWIHVGLSLTSYDETIRDLYRNTLMLSLGCAIFSLLVAVFYARRPGRADSPSSPRCGTDCRRRSVGAGGSREKR
jgi:two-component system NtrC family sensor kinase